jgi:signal transduction histidine kinase
VQDLAGQLTLAEAKERARLAQVLHDELQQQLYAVQFALRGLRPQLRDGVAGLNKLEEVKRLIDEAVAISRTTTANLSPPVLHNEGWSKRSLGSAVTWQRATALLSG